MLAGDIPVLTGFDCFGVLVSGRRRRVATFVGSLLEPVSFIHKIRK